MPGHERRLAREDGHLFFSSLSFFALYGVTDSTVSLEIMWGNSPIRIRYRNHMSR
jgi:hypothetical protein